MVEQSVLPFSEAEISTAASSKYLAQLCKHFQHKLSVSFDAQHGRIEFPAGVCTLDAATKAETLVMRVNAKDESGLATLEDVVARHLQRFAFREPFAINWTRHASN
ncbi:MAG TPA: DUF2218 domain-containing protein [Magnetospirillaceae bacterium]|jgi:hypothetical protein